MNLPSDALFPDPASARPLLRSTDKDDALLQCFKFILGLYDFDTDIASITTNLPLKTGFLEPADLHIIGEKIGIDVHIKKLSLSEIKTVQAPAIVLLKDRKAIVQLPQKTHEGKIFSPSSPAPAALESFAETYMGYAAIIHPAEKDKAHTEHMWTLRGIDWFWNPIFSHWSNYVEILICSVLLNIFAIILPLYTMNIYDRVVPNFAEDTLYVLTFGILTAFIFDFLFRTIRSYILERVASTVGAKFDLDLLEQFLIIPPDSIKMSVGEKANIFKELQGIRDFYASRLAPTFVDLPFFFFFIVIIALICPTLSLVPIIGAILILIINSVAQLPINQSTKKYFSAIQDKSSLLIELLSGIETLRMFNAGGSKLFTWNVTVSHSAHTASKNQFVMTVAGNLSGMIVNMVNIFVVFFGVYEIHAGNLSTGGLIAITMLSGRAIAPIVNVSSVVSRMKKSRDILRTVDKLFRIEPEAKPGQIYSTKGPFKGKIEFRNVSFAYEDQPIAAINDVSLIIQPGEKVGLIGQTGAGKTTLAMMMARHLYPKSGTILIDDYASDAIHPVELRRHIGLVPQRSFYFSGSIRDNITLGSPDIDREAFERATLISGLSEYIQQTGQGFDTQIGEGAHRLSGGQQQAIALARAVIRNPSIMIFDEPMTGMDQNLEAKVKEALKSFIKDKTFIMVTHRTTLLPLVDRLIFLNKGKIILDGPRDEVLKKLST